MKDTIEIPYKIGDSHVWALIYEKPMEVDIVGYNITENYNQPKTIIYKVTKSSNSSQSYDVMSDCIYPSKSAIQLKLTELEDLRHSEVLTAINSI